MRPRGGGPQRPARPGRGALPAGVYVSNPIVRPVRPVVRGRGLHPTGRGLNRRLDSVPRGPGHRESRAGSGKTLASVSGHLGGDRGSRGDTRCHPAWELGTWAASGREVRASLRRAVREIVFLRLQSRCSGWPSAPRQAREGCLSLPETGLMGLVPAPVWTCWTCLWTSAGPKSSKETLEKCGVYPPVWTFWTSFRTSGHGTMRFGYMDRQGMIQPAAASDRQRSPECPDGAMKPPFFQDFLAGHRSRRGPAEVQQVRKMSRIDRLKTCAVSWADGWSGRHLPYRIERTDRPTIPGRSRRMA